MWDLNEKWILWLLLQLIRNSEQTSTYPGRGGRDGVGNGSFQRRFKGVIEVNGFPTAVFLKKMDAGTSSWVLCVQVVILCQTRFQSAMTVLLPPPLPYGIKVYNRGKEMRTAVGGKSPALSSPLKCVSSPLGGCCEVPWATSRTSQAVLAGMPAESARQLCGPCGARDPISRVRCLACLIQAVAYNGHGCLVWPCTECHSDVSPHLPNTFSYLL